MTILLTGAAGFIGFHVSRALLERGETVVGIDSLNDYYDVTLKKARLAELKKYDNFHFEHLDITDRDAMMALPGKYSEADRVIHLAAQAGVRYSLTHPFSYGDTNLIGHLTILEMCRNMKNMKHLVYASSSSVYGGNTKMPFSVEDRVDHPISLYAATKKAAEMMTESYAHLYNIPATGLRFFTVYGPWGRPDMSAFIFAKAILEGKDLPVFNQGKMSRNFTYVDDVVAGTIGCLDRSPVMGETAPRHRVYNIGNDKPEELMTFIHLIEDTLGKKGNLNLLPMQPGDVKATVADITNTTQDLGFEPKTNINDGIKHFINWYKEYYNV